MSTSRKVIALFPEPEYELAEVLRTCFPRNQGDCGAADPENERAWQAAIADIDGAGLEHDVCGVLRQLCLDASIQPRTAFMPWHSAQEMAKRIEMPTRRFTDTIRREIAGKGYRALGLDPEPYRKFAIWMHVLITRGRYPLRVE